MKNIINKTFKLSCLIGLMAVLSGCAGMCPMHKPEHKKHAKPAHRVEYYQTYNDADVNQVKAKMYTRSRHGGESKMGCVKFKETDSGLKMSVDLIDLRPGVVYTPRIYQCNQCSSQSGKCCGRSMISADLPKLQISHAGRLEETYMLRGLTAKQLQNAQIYLERDGGYRAAWGTLDNM